jgi:glycosyltransferase involved in cell wall biosynthesis
MAAGKPVVCYKLDGVPSEYDEFLIYADPDDPDSLRQKLKETCALSPDVRLAFGKAARGFVLTKKNHIVQTKKILELLSFPSLKCSPEGLMQSWPTA